MINNPKDIQEVLNVIDNITKEQLDEAIKVADERSEYMNEEEKIKNIEEILELCREELPYNEDISATLDYEDLESLECLYKMYQQEKEKNKKLEEVIDMIAEDIFESCADIICDKTKESGDCFARNYGSARERTAEKMGTKINQYDLNGNLIKTWKSMREAERKLGIPNQSISLCCLGRRNKTGGFKWRYFDE